VSGPAAAGGTTTISAPTTSTAATTTTPRSVLDRALAAAKTEPTVHFVASSTVGKRTYTVSGDAAAKTGAQDITLRDGTQTGSMKVLLVHDTVYFQGDTLGLTNYLGLPSSLAPAYAGKWISFAHDNQGFATIAASLTIKAAISQISLGGPLSIPAGQAGAGATLLLAGTSGALSTNNKREPATLVVTTTSPPLPVTFTARGKDGTSTSTGSVTFSDWGETFRVTAPAHAIPNTSVGTR
jgi:hypothetical protein